MAGIFRTLLVLDALACAFGVVFGFMLAGSGSGFLDLSGLGRVLLVVSAVLLALDIAAWGLRRKGVLARTGFAFLLALLGLAALVRFEAQSALIGSYNLVLFGFGLALLTQRAPHPHP